jgi:hypothetical protein
MDDGFSAPESYVAFGTFAGFDPTMRSYVRRAKLSQASPAGKLGL